MLEYQRVDLLHSHWATGIDSYSENKHHAKRRGGTYFVCSKLRLMNE